MKKEIINPEIVEPTPLASPTKEQKDAMLTRLAPIIDRVNRGSVIAPIPVDQPKSFVSFSSQVTKLEKEITEARKQLTVRQIIILEALLAGEPWKKAYEKAGMNWKSKGHSYPIIRPILEKINALQILKIAHSRCTKEDVVIRLKKMMDESEDERVVLAAIALLGKFMGWEQQPGQIGAATQTRIVFEEAKREGENERME